MPRSKLAKDFFFCYNGSEEEHKNLYVLGKGVTDLYREWTFDIPYNVTIRNRMKSGY
jgi:hypothetical protein